MTWYDAVKLFLAYLALEQTPLGEDLPVPMPESAPTPTGRPPQVTPPSPLQVPGLGGVQVVVHTSLAELESWELGEEFCDRFCFYP